MKKLLAIAALLVASAVSQAQGTLNFGNFNGDTVNAPIYHVDRTTGLDGAGFLAQLYLQTGTAEAPVYTAVGSTLSFFSGAGAGYLDNTESKGIRTVTGVAGGAQATFVVRAWEVASGATYETAAIKGQSAAFTVTLGGAGSPPSLPTDLVGLQSFSLVPEPSTIALAMLGGAALFLRRRK